MMDVTSTYNGVDGSETRPAAAPFTFEGTIGLFEPARGLPRSVAVLFANPWGLEELCARKFRRVIAEALAATGIASLRFDYPFTGDALDNGIETASLRHWTDAFAAALDHLKARSGCDHVVVIAQGVGSIVATKAMREIKGVDALVLLAPVVSGRTYVRELSILSQVVKDKLGVITDAGTADGLSVAGLGMPKGIVDDLKAINLGNEKSSPASQVLVFTRANNPADTNYAEYLQQLGAHVRSENFDGYENLTTNPTVAVIPRDVVLKIVSWVEDLYPVRKVSQPPVTPPTLPHSGPGFAEKPVRFGEGNRLLGVFCRPLAPAPAKVAVLILSSGYDPMSGWARSSARIARALAVQGIASLRFDGANVAESPPLRGAPEQVLYDAAQIADVNAAVSFLQRQEPQAAILAAGRCSGAYLGFQAICEDERIEGLVAVNPVVFEWPEGQSVDEAVAKPAQSMGHYYQRLQQGNALKRVLRGEVDIPVKIRQIAQALLRKALAPINRGIGGFTRRERTIYASFGHLAARSVPVTLLYSVNDVGLDEFSALFGRDGSTLKKFGSSSWQIIEDADHYLTPSHAVDRYIQTIIETGRTISSRKSAEPLACPPQTVKKHAGLEDDINS